jgi:hypothetical protein
MTESNNKKEVPKKIQLTGWKLRYLEKVTKSIRIKQLFETNSTKEN